jgi:hypothetical protein
MPSPIDVFMFDPNFAFGDESVFTLIDDTAGSPVPPPIIGYFLVLEDDTPFLLLSGTELELLS